MADFAIDTTSFNKAARYPQRYGYQVRGTNPTSIVVHSTEGVRGQTLGSAARYLYGSAKVSAHYLIGREGVILQQLDPGKHQAWHAGDVLTSWENAKSIGIELLHARGEDWPAVQKDALAWLLRKLMADYRIPLLSIQTHGQVAIPGPYKRKSDPTDWPHAEFIAWRNRLIPLVNPLDPFADWGDIAKPTGVAIGFAVPRAWLVNKRLGRCVAGETYSASGKYSITEFENGLITYMKARNVALVELF